LVQSLYKSRGEKHKREEIFGGNQKQTPEKKITNTT
jgi:hypothetical protein